MFASDVFVYIRQNVKEFVSQNQTKDAVDLLNSIDAFISAYLDDLPTEELPEANHLIWSFYGPYVDDVEINVEHIPIPELPEPVVCRFLL